MKFLLNPTAEVAARARPPVRVFLAFSMLLVIGLAAQRAASGGFSPAGVRDAYAGEAASAVALWEEVHQLAFLYGFLTLAIGSLLVVSPLPARARSVLIGAMAAATLADLFAPFAILALRGGGVLRLVTGVACPAALLAAAGAAFATFASPQGPGPSKPAPGGNGHVHD